MTAEEIKALLKAKKIKNRDLCRRWKKPESTVSMLVNRKLKSAPLERKLARVLGVDVDELRALPPKLTVPELSTDVIANLHKLAKALEEAQS